MKVVAAVIRFAIYGIVGTAAGLILGVVTSLSSGVSDPAARAQIVMGGLIGGLLLGLAMGVKQSRD